MVTGMENLKSPGQPRRSPRLNEGETEQPASTPGKANETGTQEVDHTTVVVATGPHQPTPRSSGLVVAPLPLVERGECDQRALVVGVFLNTRFHRSDGAPRHVRRSVVEAKGVARTQ